MGVKEKRREKKEKTKAETEPEIEVTPTETLSEAEPMVIERERKAHRPEVIIRAAEMESESIQQQTTTDAVEVLPEAESEILLPQWGDASQSEWMYSIPPRDEDKVLWAHEWGDFLLEWTQSKGVHVLSISIFLKEMPFSDMLGKVDAFRMIGDALVEKEVADWLDRSRRQLRVYWRPLEEWADMVYEWAINTGNLSLDLKSIVIQESGEDFAQLPERDIGIVLGFIVEKGLATWIDKKLYAIRIEI
ncbi:MAG: hypothetical protein P1Q69_10295 [Candidatus Thorarchaeota archaeon]|nr:hypothetical protein [Candidatus Thorarchaeota archaeon]